MDTCAVSVELCNEWLVVYLQLKKHELPCMLEWSLCMVLMPLPPQLVVQHQLELERAARHDLEMHTEQLKSQKALLQEELTALQRQFEQGEPHSTGQYPGKWEPCMLWMVLPRLL